MNMHVYWTGLAADLWRAGDRSLEWLLRGAVKGEVYAAGHGETGNDLPVLLSTTKAERVDGGYRFTGRKSFGSLAPVWTSLGLHGLDASDPERRRSSTRSWTADAKGYRIEETWDVLGMRATRSEDTLLEGAFVPDERIARVVPAGPAGLDAFVLGVFAWALLGFGNIYYGLARRAFDLTVERVKSKTSLGLYPLDGVPRRGAARGRRDGARAGRDRASPRPRGRGLVHRRRPRRDLARAHRGREVPRGRGRPGAWSTGRSTWPAASASSAAAGLERLFRDARLGRMHPANTFLTHEIVAKTALGIGLDESPRWG